MIGINGARAWSGSEAGSNPHLPQKKAPSPKFDDSAIRSVRDPRVQAYLSPSYEYVKSRRFHPSPTAWEDQVFYFFLPDRFSDNREQGYTDNYGATVTNGATPLFTEADRNNATQNSTTRRAWYDAGSKFVGGNLRGATSKLGYLKRMGVTTLWLGPIFKQTSDMNNVYHGYAIQDFLAVDPRFGTREDLREMVKTAHSMGILVIMDIILNHCGDVFAYEGGGAMYYTGQTYDVKGWWSNPRNFGTMIPFGPINLNEYPDAFSDSGVWPMELQDLNCFARKGQIRNWDESPEFVEGDFFGLKSFDLGDPDPMNFNPSRAIQVLTDVYKFWMAYADIDGFRLDTVKHMGVGPSRYFVNEIRRFARSLGKTKFLLLGECAGTQSFQHSIIRQTGLDAALGIGDLQQALWRIPRNAASPAAYFSAFANRPSSRKWTRNQIVNMLDDHDQIWRPDLKARFCATNDGKALLKAALGLNLCTVGIPCIYYGTEQELDGTSDEPRKGAEHFGDQFIREAMFGGPFGPFHSVNRHVFNEQSETYRFLGELTALRKSEPALRRGSQYLCAITTGQSSKSKSDQRICGFSLNSLNLGLSSCIPSVPEKRNLSIIAWMRVYEREELLCAMNTDIKNAAEAWVTMGRKAHSKLPQGEWRCLLPSSSLNATLKIGHGKDLRIAVCVKLPPAGFAVYKWIPDGSRQRSASSGRYTMSDSS